MGIESEYEIAKCIVRRDGHAGYSSLQRRLGIGYAAADQLIKQMQSDGILGEYDRELHKYPIINTGQRITDEQRHKNR